MCDSPLHWLGEALEVEYHRLWQPKTRTDASLRVHAQVTMAMWKFGEAVQAGHSFQEYADAAAEAMRPGDVAAREAWRRAMAVSAARMRKRRNPSVAAATKSKE